MKARLRDGVRIRRDVFGGICYIPHRDDFFAVTERVYETLKSLQDASASGQWSMAQPELEKSYCALARLGICETADPATPEEAYSGPAFLGEFAEIPTVSDPLVLNCFCTAFCPLECIYCHADDLMQQFRGDESFGQLENVISTARMINSLVVVITGGDPLTKPERAKRLIEALAGPRALVLDTSGVGDLEALLPTLKKFNVHVRISLDAISPTNRKLRPVNRNIEKGTVFSGEIAQAAIRRCLAEGLGTTVQTVITSVNDKIDELRDLRDWLVANGVRNWVLHMTVKGGKARKMQEAATKYKRKRGIVPDPSVYDLLQELIDDTRVNKIPLDIRCTDTDTTPNSVLLVASDGSLYTEGYAHHGKVLLYNSTEGRPDTLQKLWHYLDRFGHARRYLNWNPNFNGSISLDKACYQIPLPPKAPEKVTGIVEAEAKYRILDPPNVTKRLLQLGFIPGEPLLQLDDYYDTPDRKLHSLDYVIRVRQAGTETMVVVKGPRNWTTDGEYSRIELEFVAKSSETVHRDLNEKGLRSTWHFEKRRTSFRSSQSPLRVELDEIPQVGFFLEIEGIFDNARSLAAQLSLGASDRERKNYQEIFLEFVRNKQQSPTEITGASF